MAESYEQVTYKGKTEFLPYTVLDAAYARFEMLYRLYDEVTIWFSGGKDSQLTIELARRALDKMGQGDRKVHVSFIDMEFIEDEVIRTVEDYAADPRIEMIWIAHPQIDHMVVMGERQVVTLWDRAREDSWGRLLPDDAMIDIPGFDGQPITRANERAAISQACKTRGVKGSLAIVNSQRFAENEVIRMVTMKGQPDTCWITKNPEGLPGVDMVRPIYDWSVKDVFRFFYEEGIPYSMAYDINMHSGNALRAGTPPLDLVSSGKLESLRNAYPTLFGQITTMWPQMLTHERYAQDIDIDATIARYRPGWGGMADYIRENISDPDARSAAVKAVHKARTAREGQRTRGKGDAPCYNMPMLWVWQELVRGNYRRGIPKKHNPSKAMIEFEARVAGQG